MWLRRALLNSATFLAVIVPNAATGQERHCVSVPAFGSNFVVLDINSDELINVKSKKRLRIPGLFSGLIMEWTDLRNGQTLITNESYAYIVSYDLVLKKKEPCQFAVMRDGHLMLVQELRNELGRYRVRWNRQLSDWRLTRYDFISGISSNGKVLKVTERDDKQVLYSISADNQLTKLLTYVPKFSQAGIGFLEQLSERSYVAGHQDSSTGMEISIIRNGTAKRLFGIDAFDQKPMIFRAGEQLAILNRWQYPDKSVWRRGTDIHTVERESHIRYVPPAGTKALRVSRGRVIALVKLGNRNVETALVPRAVSRFTLPALQ